MIEPLTAQVITTGSREISLVCLELFLFPYHEINIPTTHSLAPTRILITDTLAHWWAARLDGIECLNQKVFYMNIVWTSVGAGVTSAGRGIIDWIRFGQHLCLNEVILKITIVQLVAQA